MLTSVSVPIYAAGFYTLTSGGHSNFRLLTEYLQKRRSEHPNLSVGEGRHADLNLFPNHHSVLEVKISQKPEREITDTHTVRVGARRLSHGVNMPVRRPSLLVG